MNNFKESEHPRDEEGKFTNKNKTSSSAIGLIEPLDEETFYKGVKMEYENSTNQDMLNYIFQQLEQPNPKSKFKISTANPRQIKDIQNLLGIDVTGFENIIDYNAINHIKKRHGMNGQADQSMSNPKDLARIGYILENYDSLDKVYKNGKEIFSQYQNRDGSRANIILYKKRINGYYITSQAVVDSKKKRLSIETAYKINKKR